MKKNSTNFYCALKSMAYFVSRESNATQHTETQVCSVNQSLLRTPLLSFVSILLFWGIFFSLAQHSLVSQACMEDFLGSKMIGRRCLFLPLNYPSQEWACVCILKMPLAWSAFCRILTYSSEITCMRKESGSFLWLCVVILLAGKAGSTDLCSLNTESSGRELCFPTALQNCK